MHSPAGELLRLLTLRAAPVSKRLCRHLPDLDRLRLAYALVPPASPAVASVLHLPEALCESPPGLSEDLIETACARAFIEPVPQVRSPEDFDLAYRRGEGRLAEALDRICALCTRILDPYREVLALRGRSTLPPPVAADVERQLAHLVFPRLPARDRLGGAARSAPVPGGARAAAAEDPPRRVGRREEARGLRAAVAPLCPPRRESTTSGAGATPSWPATAGCWRSSGSPSSRRSSAPPIACRRNASTSSGA